MMTMTVLYCYEQLKVFFLHPHNNAATEAEHQHTLSGLSKTRTHNRFELLPIYLSYFLTTLFCVPNFPLGQNQLEFSQVPSTIISVTKYHMPLNQTEL